MTSRALRLWALVVVLVCATVVSATAQTPISVSLDSVFFGDNAEFFSPFRTGETVLGAWQRVNADFQLSDKATLRLGLFALERNGSDKRTELARPVVSLTMGTKRHRFIFGTLETGGQPQGMGPDRMTPHGLLPMLAVETLWFNRAYQAGLQWITDTQYVKQDLWFDYQKVITPDHREVFDAGFVGRLQPSETAPIALLYQFEVVHHGGQQFDVGPVSDSFAYGPGLLLRHRLPVVGKLSLETYGLMSHDRPDREQKALDVKGRGFFARLAAEHANWRAHGIVWRAKDFKHEEGDPNYLSESYDRTVYRSNRRYLELGLARLFHPAPTVDFEVSGRAARVEDSWGYTYRLMATVHLGVWHSAATP